jgi:hypothetical protein
VEDQQRPVYQVLISTSQHVLASFCQPGARAPEFILLGMLEAQLNVTPTSLKVQFHCLRLLNQQGKGTVLGSLCHLSGILARLFL